MVQVSAAGSFFRQSPRTARYVIVERCPAVVYAPTCVPLQPLQPLQQRSAPTTCARHTQRPLPRLPLGMVCGCAHVHAVCTYTQRIQAHLQFAPNRDRCRPEASSLHVCVCVCVCVCMCVCVYIYNMYIHTHIHIYVYIHTYIYARQNERQTIRQESRRTLLACVLTHFKVSNTRLPGEASCDTSQKPPVEGRLRLRRSPRALAKGNVDVDLCL